MVHLHVPKKYHSEIDLLAFMKDDISISSNSDASGILI